MTNPLSPVFLLVFKLNRSPAGTYFLLDPEGWANVVNPTPTSVVTTMS